MKYTIEQLERFLSKKAPDEDTRAAKAALREALEPDGDLRGKLGIKRGQGRPGKDIPRSLAINDYRREIVLAYVQKRIRYTDAVEELIEATGKSEKVVKEFIRDMRPVCKRDCEAFASWPSEEN